MFKYFLPLILISNSAAFSDKMSWCDYWYRRGVARSECARPRQQHWSIASQEPNRNKNMLSMPICDVVTDWGRCQRSDHCPVGLLCWVRGSPCCTPQATNTAIATMNIGTEQCPTPEAMGISCNVQNGVNWCHTDNDCHQFNRLQKCCPSGCGYNLCVKISLPIDMNARLSPLSAVPNQCPGMDVLPITCSTTHGVSWCHSDDHCYSNGALKRHCCPTRCGYNVCLLRLDATRWIIA